MFPQSDMMQRRVLFVPPRLAEERKVYFNPAGFTQAAIATAGGNGLGALGDWFTDILNTVSTNVGDLVQTFTGQKAQAQAREQALELAQLRARQAEAEAQARSQGWGQAAPWIAVGAAVLGVAVVMAARK